MAPGHDNNDDQPQETGYTQQSSFQPPPHPSKKAVQTIFTNGPRPSTLYEERLGNTRELRSRRAREPITQGTTQETTEATVGPSQANAFGAMTPLAQQNRRHLTLPREKDLPLASPTRPRRSIEGAFVPSAQDARQTEYLKEVLRTPVPGRFPVESYPYLRPDDGQEQESDLDEVGGDGDGEEDSADDLDPNQRPIRRNLFTSKYPRVDNKQGCLIGSTAPYTKDGPFT